MDKAVCCVCERPLNEQIGIRQIGSRWYCQDHYAQATAGSRGQWLASAALVVGLVLFGLLAGLAAPSLGENLSDGSLLLVGIIIALVPAVVYLGLFYLQDRLEPEPKHYVGGLFVLGALLGHAIVQPVLYQGLEIGTWLSTNNLTSFLGNALVRELLSAGLVYFAIRLTVFNSHEFDEPVDGIIYAMAVGLGIATTLNVNYVLSSGGVALGVGTIRIIILSLAQVGFAALLGYILAGVKLRGMPPGLAALGVLGVALVAGAYDWLVSAVSIGDLGYDPLPGLLVSGLVAALAIGLAFLLVRRSYQEQLANIPVASASTR